MVTVDTINAEFNPFINEFGGVFEGGVAAFYTYAYTSDYAYNSSTKKIAAGTFLSALVVADTTRLSVPAVGTYTAAKTYEKNTFICYLEDANGQDSIVGNATMRVTDTNARSLEYKFVISGTTASGRNVVINITGQNFYIDGEYRAGLGEVTTPLSITLPDVDADYTAFINMGNTYTDDSVTVRLIAMDEQQEYLLYVDILTPFNDPEAKTIADGTYNVLADFSGEGVMPGLCYTHDTYGTIRGGSYLEWVISSEYELYLYFYLRKGSLQISSATTDDATVYTAVLNAESLFGTPLQKTYTFINFFTYDEISNSAAIAAPHRTRAARPATLNSSKSIRHLTPKYDIKKVNVLPL